MTHTSRKGIQKNNEKSVLDATQYRSVISRTGIEVRDKKCERRVAESVGHSPSTDLAFAALEFGHS